MFNSRTPLILLMEKGAYVMIGYVFKTRGTAKKIQNSDHAVV